MDVPALKRPEGNTDPDPTLTIKLREVVSGLCDGKHDPALFTPPMQIFLKTATGKGFWKWFGAHGAIGAFTFSDAEEIEGGRVLRYQVMLGGNRYWLSCKLTRDGKIAQIHW
jgi:hypothetical protein